MVLNWCSRYNLTYLRNFSCCGQIECRVHFHNNARRPQLCFALEWQPLKCTYKSRLKPRIENSKCKCLFCYAKRFSNKLLILSTKDKNYYKTMLSLHFFPTLCIIYNLFVFSNEVLPCERKTRQLRMYFKLRYL